MPRSGPSWTTTALLLVGLLLVGALLLVAATPEAAWGRAGSGQGYRGGGRSGSGYSGGSRGYSSNDDGGGALIALLIWLVIQHPVIGIPLVIAAVVFFAYFGKQAKEIHTGGTIRRGREARDELTRAEAERILKQVDPHFDSEALLQRVNKAFLKLQEAWCAQDLRPIRPFVSDGVFERFSVQIDDQKRRHLRDHMEGTAVLKSRVAEVRDEGEFHVVTVRITAIATDWTEDTRSGTRVDGGTSASTFTEYWSFLRRRPASASATGEPPPPLTECPACGAPITGDGITCHKCGSSLKQSAHLDGDAIRAGKGGLMEGKCPNCGANAEINQHAACRACGALLRSGDFDWVLAEITQACEWEPALMRNVPGAERFRDRVDPGLTLQHLEDRASVAFWRRAVARREKAVDRIRTIALPDYCAEIVAEQKRAQRVYHDRCAVGAVETKVVVEGQTWDQALIEVAWSGTAVRIDKDGKAQRSQRVISTREGFVLGRRHGTKTDLAHAVSSGHCPNCGGPEKGSPNGQCPYCGTLLNTGDKDWILLRALVPFEDELRTLRREALAQAKTASPVEKDGGGKEDGPRLTMDWPDAAPVSARKVIGWMIRVMLADGEIDKDELRALMAAAKERELPLREVERMIEAAKADELETPEPRDPREAKAWMLAMARMALADGRITREEKVVLLVTGQRMGLSKYDVKQMVQKAKTELYQEAKEALRAVRS